MRGSTNVYTPEISAYSLSNIRFEPAQDGFATIWFDLGGEAFAEPQAMKNVYVEFHVFLEYLEKEHPAMHAVLANELPGHDDWIERLEAANFDWEGHLKIYLDRHVDLSALEEERLKWLNNRNIRADDPETAAFEADWLQLSSQAEESAEPSWDDVMHALVDSLNDTVVDLYPEVLDFSDENTARLREMFESHGERLANQLVALTRSVKKSGGTD